MAPLSSATHCCLLNFCCCLQDYALIAQLSRVAHEGENSSVLINMSSSDFNFSLEFYV